MDGEKQPLLKSASKHKCDDAGGQPSNYFLRFVQPTIAEFLGTTMFVFIGTMIQQNDMMLAMGIGTGLAYAMLVFSFGQLSGGHFNPAVTLGVVLSKGIPIVLGCMYVAAQVLGSILGAAFTRGILSINGSLPFLPDDPSTSVYYKMSGGANQLHSNKDYEANPAVGILNEALFTYVLVTVAILMTVDTKTKSPMAGLPMGLSLTVGIIAGGSVTEGSFNPARSLGPCIVISDMRPEVWLDHYVYWVGPLLGAVVAALLYRLFLAHEDRRVLFK